MSEYSMPVLSEQERQELIGLATIEVKRWEIADGKQYMVELMNIALAALTAKPVAWGVNDTRCHTHEGAGYFPLYEIPPVPVKQEGEQ